MEQWDFHGIPDAMIVFVSARFRIKRLLKFQKYLA